jgi:hypothetical protein
MKAPCWHFWALKQALGSKIDAAPSGLAPSYEAPAPKSKDAARKTPTPALMALAPPLLYKLMLRSRS